MKISYRLFSIVFALIALTQVSCSQDKSEKKVLGLELGAKLPEIKATTQFGKEVPLAAAKGNRWVFVFFYPKALTGG